MEVNHLIFTFQISLWLCRARRISVSFVDDQAVSNVTIKAKSAVSRPIDSKNLPQYMDGGYNSEGWDDKCAWEVDTDYDSLDEEHVDEDGFNYDRCGDRFVYHVQVRFHTFPRLMGGVEDACRVWLGVVRVYYTT